MFKILQTILVVGTTVAMSFGQEFSFTVSVQAPALQVTAERVIQSLETQLTEFINNNQWTQDQYQDHEKIKGSLNLTISNDNEDGFFEGEIAIQASRPVYGSSYQSVLLNHNDRVVNFRFEESQPIIFTENAFTSNLSSIVAFYLYYILGVDGDSFALYGGDENYARAKEIYDLLPPNLLSSDAGWDAQSNVPNRFFMIDNMLNPKARPMRKAIYEYHRSGLDRLYENVDEAKEVMLTALKSIEQVNADYPKPMIAIMFANAKYLELVEVFAVANRTQKNEVYRIMTAIDPSNRNKYAAIRR